MIVLPMAGLSSRFFVDGYTLPKYRLKLGQKTIFEHVLGSFKIYFKNDLFAFGLNTKFLDSEFVESVAKGIGIQNFCIIPVGEQTLGQAHTVNIMLQHLQTEDELYVFNIDTIHHRFVKLPFVGSNYEAYLELFSGVGDHWSFAKLDENFLAVEFAEKKRISNYCSNGLYAFKSARKYTEIFEKYEKQHRSELYIAPMLNLYLENSLPVFGKICSIEDFTFCGTPVEFEKARSELSC